MAYRNYSRRRYSRKPRYYRRSYKKRVSHRTKPGFAKIAGVGYVPMSTENLYELKAEKLVEQEHKAKIKEEFAVLKKEMYESLRDEIKEKYLGGKTDKQKPFVFQSFTNSEGHPVKKNKITELRERMRHKRHREHERMEKGFEHAGNNVKAAVADVEAMAEL
jgi:hypothetical protein